MTEDQETKYLRAECHVCGNFIEFPAHGVGQEIHCPFCCSPIVLHDTQQDAVAPNEAACAKSSPDPAADRLGTELVPDQPPVISSRIPEQTVASARTSTPAHPGLKRFMRRSGAIGSAIAVMQIVRRFSEHVALDSAGIPHPSEPGTPYEIVLIESYGAGALLALFATVVERIWAELHSMAPKVFGYPEDKEVLAKDRRGRL